MSQHKKGAGTRSPRRQISRMALWWGHVQFVWATGNRVPWMLGVGASVVMVAIATLVFSMESRAMERRELMCLATNVYYESRGEPIEGQYAVAEVTLNRVASARYPSTICEVVHQEKWDYLRKRQVSAFSWTEFDKLDAPRGEAWRRAGEVAETVYFGRRDFVLAGAVHYHASYIRPSWSRGKKPVAKIGKHLFFK